MQLDDNAAAVIYIFFPTSLEQLNLFSMSHVTYKLELSIETTFARCEWK